MLIVSKFCTVQYVCTVHVQCTIFSRYLTRVLRNLFSWNLLPPGTTPIFTEPICHLQLIRIHPNINDVSNHGNKSCHPPIGRWKFSLATLICSTRKIRSSGCLFSEKRHARCFQRIQLIILWLGLAMGESDQTPGRLGSFTPVSSKQ